MDPWFQTNLYGHSVHSPVHSMAQQHQKWKQHPTGTGSSFGSDTQFIGPNTSHGLHSHSAPTSSAGQATSLPHHPNPIVSLMSRSPIRRLPKSSVDVSSADSSTSRPGSTTPKASLYTVWSGYNNSASASYGNLTSASVIGRTVSATADKQKQQYSWLPSSLRQIKPAHLDSTGTVASSARPVAMARLNSSLITTKMSSGGAVEKHPSSQSAIPTCTASPVSFCSNPPPARHALHALIGKGSIPGYTEPTRHLDTRTLGSVAPVRGSQRTVIAESDSTSDAIRPSTSLPSASRDPNVGYGHHRPLNRIPSAANLRSKTTTASDTVSTNLRSKTATASDSFSTIPRSSVPKHPVGTLPTSLPTPGFTICTDPMCLQALYSHHYQPYHPNHLYPPHFPHLLVNPLDPYSNYPYHGQPPVNSLHPYLNYPYSPLVNPFGPNQNYPYPSHFPHAVNPFDPIFQSLQSNGGMLPSASVYGQLTPQKPVAIHPAFNLRGARFAPPPSSLASSEANEVDRE